MPLYAYRCQSCGFQQDVLQKLSDAPLTQCPACGCPTFCKQLTAAGFRLKGSGWYVTDFRDSGHSRGAQQKEQKESKDSPDLPAPNSGSDSPASAASESKSEAKGDTAPGASMPSTASDSSV